MNEEKPSTLPLRTAPIVCAVMIMLAPCNISRAQASNGETCGTENAAPPAAFSFLEKQFEELTRNYCSRNSALAQTEVSAAQVEIARSAHYPTLTMTSSTGLQQTWNYEDGTQINKDDTYTKNLSAGVELSEKIWSGGADSLGVTAAEHRLKAQQVEERSARFDLQTGLVRELVKILNSARATRQKEKEQEKWRLLNELTHRKAKAGHLSQRDTLQSDKEYANATLELDTAQRGLEHDLAITMNRYDLREQRLKASDLTSLEASFAKILASAENVIRSTSLSDEVARRSLDLEKLRAQKEAVESDTSQRRIQILNPGLSAVASANGNYIDNVNRSPNSIRGITAPQPNWTVTGSIGLRFSLSLFNPRALAATDEIYAQQRYLITQESASLRNIQLQCETWMSDYAENQTRLEGQRKVLGTVQSLAEGNSQLYDAGLIDTFQLIRGFQELYAQERAIIELENQMRLTALNALLAREFGRLQTGI